MGQGRGFALWVASLSLGFGIAATGSALVTTPAIACSCVPPGAPSIELAQAEAVFEGHVIDLFTKDENWPNHAKGACLSRVARVMVKRSWKGPLAGTKTMIATGTTCGDCGYELASDAHYLFYAYKLASTDAGAPEYGVSACSRTVLSTNASADFAALGAPSSVFDESSPKPPLARTPEPKLADPKDAERPRTGCTRGCSVDSHGSTGEAALLAIALGAIIVRGRARSSRSNRGIGND